MDKLELADIEFFAGLSGELLERLEQVMEIRSFPAFSVVCRKGDAGRYFYAIATGGVSISLAAGQRKSNIYMGAGQVFGEMSLLADLPVSATVQTVKDSELYCFPKQTFTQLLDSEPEFYRSLVEMLVNRLRHRSDTLGGASRPSCCFFVYTQVFDGLLSLQNQLFSSICHYNPGSRSIEIVEGSDQCEMRRSGQQPEENDEIFPPSDESLCFYPSTENGSEFRLSASANWLNALVKNWRTIASIDQVLFLSMSMTDFMGTISSLERGDTVVAVVTHNNDGEFLELEQRVGQVAAYTTVSISDRDPSAKGSDSAPWGFRIPASTLFPVLAEDEQRVDSTIDWVARWVTQREIGLCFSAGAARGFAHLGVLEVLEKANIPIDYVSGTSMGGIVALVYAMTGSAEHSIRVIREALGSNRKVRDLSFVPRGSLYAGKKIHHTADKVFGEILFSELKRPCAVVAADLVHGERLVINRGRAVEAALATSAIPGLFPLIEKDGRLLSDGALVNRIPLDVLGERRCGFSIAVNVIPSPESRRQDGSATLKWLKDRCSSFLGLRFIIGFSWELQAWNFGVNEAESADLLISPDTRLYAGYDFDGFDEMVDAGRKAAKEQLPMIRGSIETLLKPGVP